MFLHGFASFCWIYKQGAGIGPATAFLYSGPAINELGVSAEIIKVTDINKIIDYGVMVTPALVIDGDVKVAGKIPEKEGIKRWIKCCSK